MPLLFSYGTLRLPRVQKDIFGRLLEGQPDSLIGFNLAQVEISDADVLATSGERFHPVAIKSVVDTDLVEGTVFDVSEIELAKADRYEVDDYKRKLVALASGKKAWLYAAKE